MTGTWRERLIIVAPFLGVLFLVFFTPAEDGPTFCPFALCTGTACPGCGMTRAAASLIKGDFSSALVYHPLVLLIGTQLIVGWVWFMLRRSNRVQPMRNLTLNVILISTGLALVGVWVLRLLAGSLPPV